MKKKLLMLALALSLSLFAVPALMEDTVAAPTASQEPVVTEEAIQKGIENYEEPVGYPVNDDGSPCYNCGVGEGFEDEAEWNLEDESEWNLDEETEDYSEDYVMEGACPLCGDTWNQDEYGMGDEYGLNDFENENWADYEDESFYGEDPDMMAWGEEDLGEAGQGEETGETGPVYSASKQELLIRAYTLIDELNATLEALEFGASYE